MRKGIIPSILLFVAFMIMALSFISCRGLWKHSDIDSAFVRRVIADVVSARYSSPSRDSAMIKYYSSGGELIWISSDGVKRQAVFIRFLRDLKRHGIRPQLLGLNNILDAQRNWQRCEPNESDHRNLCAARLEYLLTRTYLCYVNGLQYGFVNPAPIYNNLYEDLSAYPDTVPPPANRKKKMFHLFNIPLRHPTMKFDLEMLEGIKSDPVKALSEIQPRTLYYKKLQNELLLSQDRGKSECLCANLERARWKFRQAMGKRYVYVNTAAFMLKAVDLVKDTLFEMKICCGSFQHKSPMLTSELTYFELNPTWKIPPKIIRKEMIPAFVRDSNYFCRNNIRVFDREGHQLNSRRINWSKFLKGGIPFRLIQDSGEASDLGRIIFRFPNPFSVYLHDTSSRGTFGREERGVSHGCIRLQRPLDLAYFVLCYPKEEKMDRIRLSIGQEPRTEGGRKMKENGLNMGRRFYGFNAIPLFIDYRTVYLAANHSLVYCNDHYGFDKPLDRAINHLKY